MKILFLTISIGLLWLNSYSQKFKATEVLNKTSFEVIGIKREEINSKLMSVECIDDGFNMHYMTDIDNDQISEIYYFDKKNKCYAYRVIQDGDKRNETVDWLEKNGFKSKLPNIYDHYIIDLRATIMVDGKLMSIDYTAKPIKK